MALSKFSKSYIQSINRLKFLKTNCLPLAELMMLPKYANLLTLLRVKTELSPLSIISSHVTKIFEFETTS